MRKANCTDACFRTDDVTAGTAGGWYLHGSTEVRTAGRALKIASSSALQQLPKSQTIVEPLQHLGYHAVFRLPTWLVNFSCSAKISMPSCGSVS